MISDSMTPDSMTPTFKIYDRCFTYWEGERSELINYCIQSSVRYNNTEVWTKDSLPKHILEKTEGKPAWLRADIARLWLLKEYGGTWIDADCLCLKKMNISDLLAKYELVGFGTNKSPVFANSIFAARAKSKCIEYAYEQAIANLDAGNDGFGQCGQKILSGMWERKEFKPRMHRMERWKLAPIAWTDVSKFAMKCKDWSAEDYDIWNPNAYCYHLTNKVETLPMEGDMFLGFLRRKARRDLRPFRSKEIVSRITRDMRVGVEIGCLEGRNARNILSSCPWVHLTMVDTWGNHTQEYKNSKDNIVKRRRNWVKTKNLALERTEFASCRRTIVHKESVFAAMEVENDSVDFVFIDGDHSYEGCSIDIDAWFRKVRKGGWIGGHDFSLFPGVKKAVTERFKPEYIERSEKDDCWFVKIT